MVVVAIETAVGARKTLSVVMLLSRSSLISTSEQRRWPLWRITQLDDIGVRAHDRFERTDPVGRCVNKHYAVCGILGKFRNQFDVLVVSVEWITELETGAYTIFVPITERKVFKFDDMGKRSQGE